MKKIVGICLIMAFFSVNCSHIKPDLHPRPWTRDEKILLGIGIIAAGADCYTAERARDKGYEESNPLIGRHPTDSELIVKGWLGYSFIVILAHFYPKYRVFILGGTAMVNASFAANNSTLP